MIINSNAPMSAGQIASIYAADPHGAASDMFMNAPQARPFVEAQAAKLGMGDPETYFASLQAKKALANTVSGSQAEAMRLTGQFDPNSLPGQQAAQSAMWDKVSASRAAESAGLKANQNAILARAYPLPPPGEEPMLTPTASAEAARLKMSPIDFVRRQRLGADSVVANQSMMLPGDGRVSPDEIYNHKHFQAALASAPEQAAHVFNALTGGSLPDYQTRLAATRKDQDNYGRETLQRAFSEGKAQMSEDGASVMWRKLVPSPTEPGKMMLSDTFSEGDPFQKSLEKHMPAISEDIVRFQKLHAKKAAEEKAALATTQAARRSIPESVLSNIATGSNTLADTISGMAQDVWNIGSGSVMSLFEGGRQGYAAPASGSAITHVPAELRSNPRFRELLQKNPARAQQLIAAIQTRNAPVQDTENFNPPAL